MPNRVVIDGLTEDQLRVIVKKLGGRIGALQFLRGETVVVQRYTIQSRSVPESNAVLARDFFTCALLAKYGLTSGLAQVHFRKKLGEMTIERLAKMSDQEIMNLFMVIKHAELVKRALAERGLRPKT